jgi:hypothetical protein
MFHSLPLTLALLAILGSLRIATKNLNLVSIYAPC